MSATRYALRGWYLPACILLSACASSAQLPTRAPIVLEEGPHVIHDEKGAVTVRWIEAGKAKSATFEPGKPIEIPRFKAFFGDAFVPQAHAVQKALWPMPKRLLAISDVEGEYLRMRAFLIQHRVMSPDGRWTFGDGHVVCVGDFVDRGVQVTETLWLLHRLDREAREAGGHLHFVLGNHEAMMMGGDVRYTARKYTEVAKKLGMTVPGLLGKDTEIGRWLRSKNAVVRIGDIVFVHAGLSPQVVDKDFDYAAINGAVRKGLAVPPNQLDRKTLELVWGRYGPLWYRGYFPIHALSFGPTPEESQVTKMLERLGGRLIVVGHTKVKEISFLDAKKRLLAIDTTWTRDAIVRGVMFEGGKMHNLRLAPKPAKKDGER